MEDYRVVELPWRGYFSAYPHGPCRIEETKAEYWQDGKFIGEFPVTWTQT